MISRYIVYKAHKQTLVYTAHYWLYIVDVSAHRGLSTSWMSAHIADRLHVLQHYCTLRLTNYIQTITTRHHSQALGGGTYIHRYK